MPSRSLPEKPLPSRWRTLFPALLLAALLLFFLLRAQVHFDWPTLAHEFRRTSLARVLLAAACIYSGYVFRALRWSVLLSPIRKVRAVPLLAPQLIGFTAVGLFGRVADLSRPYLIARRTQTSVASQLAIYSIERAFDLGAAAILFSLTLALTPRSMPHHEAFARAGALSLTVTLLLAAFAVTLRVAGDRIAALSAALFRPLSTTFANAASARLLDFREGLQAITTLQEFLSALALSLALWIGIALAYYESAHAFRDTPQLATLSVAATMLLLATSMGGSLLQLPILGWFTQIAVLATALHTFFAVPVESATACAAILLLVTTLAVIPAGLMAARVQGIALRETTQLEPNA